MHYISQASLALEHTPPPSEIPINLLGHQCFPEQSF